MKFVAFERTLQGTGASRRLRNAGKVPGIVYGAGEPSMIELDHNALYHALKKESFHSSILDMEVGGKSLHVSDIVAPEGAKIVRHGSLNPVIVAVAEPKAEEEIVTAAAPAAEPAKGKGKKDEKQNKK